MKRIALAIMAGALLVPAFAGDKKPKDPPGYAWESSYDAAKIKSAEKTTLLFIDFYSEG